MGKTESKPYKVSITVITYNKESFIRKCLDSILNQEVSFDFEIIVGDDGSTDATPDILKEYAVRYPDIIFPIIRKKNIGLVDNYLETIKQCKGEYIAHVDGDDFMLPKCIKTQADYLDAHPECAIVHHRTQYVNTVGLPLGKSSLKRATTGNINDLIIQNGIGNSAKMFRAKHIDPTCFIRPKCTIGHDWYFHLAIAQHGEIHFIQKALSAYRQHNSSAMKTTDTKILFLSELSVLHIASKLQGVRKKHLRKGRSIIYFSLSRNFYKAQDYQKSWKYMKKSIKQYSITYKQLNLLIRLLFKSY